MIKLYATYFLALSFACAQAPQPNGGEVEKGDIPTIWQPSGPHCMEVPDWQVHEYNPNFYIIRQSGCLDYEKPFLYLLFGKNRGLLLDTGSRNFPAAEMIQSVVGKWLKRNNREKIEILAVHSHAHSDHIAGDEALRSMTSASIAIKVVPATIEATTELYGIRSWPDQAGTLDLGDRVIDAIPIPGHSSTSVALYDRNTGVLFTGDSLYPGRLYVGDWNDFVASTRRLVDFTKGKLVTHILGCHIEQSQTAYQDYPVGTIYQPHEHALALSRGDLLSLQDALVSMPSPARVALRDFSIWPRTTDPKIQKLESDAYKAHVKDEADRMWNQPPAK